jgi:predicted alpha/beta-fold hydrolase
LIGHLQTVVASLLPPPRVALQRSRWETPDGDFIDVDFAGDAALPRRMVLFHGLEGSSDSHYARRLARAFPAAGWRVAIPHWRGCSGEPNRKPRAYHSGDTAEVDWILRRFPAPVDVIGVSLGGNALLKWLGERSDAATAVVRRAAAVSAPLDLPACGVALDRGLNRLLYTRMFLSTLKPKSLAQLARFPQLFDADRMRRSTTFREFDDLYTAPVHGFRGVDDYWARAASGPWLEHVRVPTLVINARNDPFLPEASLLAASRKAAPCVTLELPRFGGHVGFRGGWMTKRLIDFFRA